MRIHKTFLWWISPVLLFLVLSLFVACPVFTPNVHADTTSKSSINSDISIALTGSTTLDLKPDANDGFNYTTSDLIVSTSSTDGYKILLSSYDQGNLTSPDVTNNNAIQNLSSSSTPENFTANSWGYYLGQNEPTNDSIYHPVPNESSVIIDTATSNLSHYKLAFGAKVDYELPAGFYNTTLLLSAVANPTALGALGEITYMQEMTSEICANTPDYVDQDHYAAKQLIDNRDNKSYWVAKLADGKCWMTQNLALDIPSNYQTKFTSANTQVSANWSWPYFSTTNDTRSLNSITQQKIGVSLSSVSYSYTEAYSWNLGQWVVAMPSIRTDCGQKITSMSTCMKVGLVNVSDSSKWQPLWTAQEGTWTLSGQSSPTAGYVAAHLVTEADLITHPEWKGLTGVYDSHYLIGNYYTWNTATAGSLGLVKNADASYSICPKGWYLPTGKTSGLTNFEKLYSTHNNYAKLPLAFTTSGYVDMANSITALYNTGLTGYYWSSRTDTSSNYYAIQLHVQNTAATITNTARIAGFPLRCATR